METMIEERLIAPVGIWTATLFDGDKEWNEHGRMVTPVLWTRTYRNLITNVGKQLILDHLISTGAAALTGTAVGTSATAASTADTALTNPVFKAFSSAPSRSGLVGTFVTTYLTTEANIAINEVGLLTASGGVLFNRVAPFLGFTKTNQTALELTTTLTMS